MELQPFDIFFRFFIVILINQDDGWIIEADQSSNHFLTSTGQNDSRLFLDPAGLFGSLDPFNQPQQPFNSDFARSFFTDKQLKLDKAETTVSTTTVSTDPPPPTRPANEPTVIEVFSYCNDPGKPPRSQISPVQLTYVDDEQVMYTCDEFISLKQYRRCVRGKWQGDVPICGEAFRDNDLVKATIYEAQNGFPTKILFEYNLVGKLQPFAKFGNSFIAERSEMPVRAENASNYYWHLQLQKPAPIQMVRISFSVVNHLTDSTLAGSEFDIVSVWTSQYRECKRVANNSVSPWHYNSTRFDYWYFCRSKSQSDLQQELANLSNVIRVETSSNVPVRYDLATFILAEQYSNNRNRSDPICGLPEIPVGLESRVINDQSNYVFQCAKHFKRTDTYGGQFHVMQCGFDLRWHGVLPQCVPVKQCQKFQLDRSGFLVEVYKYDKVYYINGSNEWIPISGTRAFFRCKDETNIFVGKEIRVCRDDGEWSSSLPNCLSTNTIKQEPASSLRTSTILIIVLSTLIITFVLSSCSIYFFLKLRVHRDSATMNNAFGLEMSDSSYYMSPGKQIDEVYEPIDQIENRYASYNDSMIKKLNNQQHQQQNGSTKNPFENYDYSDASSYPPLMLNSQAKPSQATSEDYYDDSNIRQQYNYQQQTTSQEQSYEVMRNQHDAQTRFPKNL